MKTQANDRIMHVNGISVAKNYVIIKNILLIALMLLSEISFSQTKAYIRRAENAIYKGNYDLGTKYYLKAVALDSNNYAANLGAGITMAYLENYEEAFPYLEKALELSDPKNTDPELIYSLGKAYHYMGIYSLALNYYQSMQKYQELYNKNYQSELAKRIEDCKYAIVHPQNIDKKKSVVINVGINVNTKMPKYVPILTGNDNRNTSTKSAGNITPVVNLGADPNPIFLDATKQKVYFTSDSEKGFGGSDIYMRVKQPSGDWGKPENLGPRINTPFDEEAPFVTTDGKTLYFSSKGLPGYGGFDIYKSVFEDGKWSVPENLGQPINSPADDIFYVTSETDDATAYFSSSRKGRFGGMDIYKIYFSDSKILKNGSPISDARFTVTLTDSALSKGAVPETIPLVNYHGVLSNAQLQEIGIDPSPLYFNFNEVTLRSDAIGILEKNVSILKKHPNLQIVANGYIDSGGSDLYNKMLSKRYATIVAEYLKKYDIKNKVEIEGKAAMNLKNNCGGERICDEAMRQLNRRVEFQVIKK